MASGRGAEMSQPNALIVYRGPLERSRLSFLAEAIARVHGPTTLVWICPRPVNDRRKARLDEFVADEPGISSARIFNGHKNRLLSVARQIQKEWQRYTGPVVAVGFTAPLYAAAIARGPYVWCVNGIPEDEALRNGSRLSSLGATMQWRVQLRLRRHPDLVVTVSEPMSQMIRDRQGLSPVFTVPNCVDLETFLFAGVSGRDSAVYSGWGAPWQNLSHLALVWSELAARDSALRFRVISGDPRARVLVERLPENRTEFQSTLQASTVAELLRVGRLGFLLREDTLTNRVSYPTKFGEYVAAGVPVMTTELDWDLSALVAQTGCGLLLDPGESPAQHAARIMSYQEEAPLTEAMITRCHDAARKLGRATWVERLAARLSELTPGRH